MSEREKWYTLKEATQVAGVAYTTLVAAVNKGNLVASQISDSSKYGYHYMVSESNLMDWVMDRHKQRAEPVSKLPTDFTAIDIAEIIEKQIKKAYDEGFRDGMKNAKAQLQTAVKGIR